MGLCDDRRRRADRLQDLRSPVRRADDIGCIQSWRERCKSSHTTCPGSSPTTMPTRLIDVGDGKSISPRLVATGGQTGHYLALSHRWGGARIFQTKLANVEKHKEGIPLDDLVRHVSRCPRHDQEARNRYIWIDSLCIIQDSSEDWEREAASMAAIYRNATLTLAAAYATSGDTGLFQPREPLSAVQMTHHCPGGQPRSSHYVLAKPGGQSFLQEVVDGP